MLLIDLMNEFLLHCKVERGLTLKSQKTFGSRLRFFHKWLISVGYDQPRLDEFNSTVVKRYLYYLVSLKHRPRSIRGGFSVIRSFGDHLVRQGVLSENPVIGIRLPKLDATSRKVVTDEEVRALLDACERHPDPQRSAMARAIVSVFAYGMLRRQECLDLKLDDVDFVNKSLVVRQGKGNKPRTVYLHPDCLAALREWIALRPKECHHDWLWALDINRRLHHEGLRRLWEGLKSIAGLAGRDHIKPHSVRHNAASRVLRAGADLRSIQAILGHSQLTTTAIYLHADEQRLREVASLGSLGVSQSEPGLMAAPRVQQIAARRHAARRLR